MSDTLRIFIATMVAITIAFVSHRTGRHDY